VGNLGVGFTFWAYSRLPMADATALLFTAPLFVTALSPLLLKERVGRIRWVAVVVGFAGTLLIIRPSAALLTNPAAFIGIAAAFFVALVDMALRNLGRTDHPLTTVFYFIVFGVLISAPFALLFGAMPSGKLLPWIIGIGIFTVIQQVAKTFAYRFAEASTLAPYTYSAIIWATLTGWVFWSDLPALPVVLGTIIIVGSNLYVLRGER
ncbi:MAG: DMT family transporter, partial [Desulfobacteraceae bacterium]|nr:DMT family transporter [Desulfobacteraceae bacterium]